MARPICLLFAIIPALVKSEVLSPYYSLNWKLDDSFATFDIEAQTLGWVGLGFNHRASMIGADLVVAGVKKGGDGYIYDRHGVADDLPPPDSSQDYELVSSSQNSTHTVLSIRRKLDTGDSKNDYKLSAGSPVTVLYAIGSEHPSNIYSFHVHTNKGTKTITFS